MRILTETPDEGLRRLNEVVSGDIGPLNARFVEFGYGTTPRSADLDKVRRQVARAKDFLWDSTMDEWPTEEPLTTMKIASRIARIGYEASRQDGRNEKRQACFCLTEFSEKVREQYPIDTAGEKRAAAVRAAIEGHAVSVRVLRLPGLAEKGDVSDWLNSGNTISALVELTGTAAIEEGNARLAHGFRAPRVGSTPTTADYNVKGIIAATGTGVLYGHSTVGKSSSPSTSV